MGKKLLVFVIVALATFLALRSCSADDRPGKDRIRRQFQTFDTTAEFVTGGTQQCSQVTKFDLFLRYFHRTEDGVGQDKNVLVWTRTTTDCHDNVLVTDGGRIKQPPLSVVINANVQKGLLVVLSGTLGQYIYTFDPSTKVQRGHIGGSENPLGNKDKHKEKSWWFWDQNPASLVMPGSHGPVRVSGLGELKIATRNVLVYGIGGK